MSCTGGRLPVWSPAYNYYTTPVFARTEATEVRPEMNTVPAGHVFLTLTLSTAAAVPAWSGGSTDGALEIVASGTSPSTEALLRLKSGRTVNFDHDALDSGSISIPIRVQVLNGSGSNADGAVRSFNLAALPLNDEAPVLPEPSNQGPYAVTGDSSVRTFTIDAATDADRGESGTLGYRVSLVAGGATVALPSWIGFTEGTREFAIAVSGRVAGDHVIVVEATDNGINPVPLVSATEDFTLFIVASGHPTFASSDTTFDLPENSAAAVVVGTVSATDSDDTDTSDAYPAYALAAGADAALFEIDPASGVISVKSRDQPGLQLRIRQGRLRVRCHRDRQQRQCRPGQHRGQPD